MTATGINATAFMSQAGSFVSVTVSQVSASDSSEFGNMFANKLQASQNRNNEQPETAIKSSKTEYSKEQATETTEIRSNDAKAPVTGTAEREIADKVEEALEELPDEITTENLEEVLEILNTLMQGIANILETTVRELQGSFEQINLVPADMLDADKLAQLVLNINQCSDMSDMLVDSDMLDAFNQIRELAVQVLEDFGYTEEDFKKITGSDLFTQLMNGEDIIDAEGLFKKLEIKPDEAEAQNDAAEPVMQDDKEAFTVEIMHTEFEDSESGASTESSEKAGTADVRRNTRGETTTSLADSFVGHIENAAKALDIDMPVAEGVTVRDIVYQLVDAVKVNIGPESTSLEMSLNPDSLGRVSLNITQKDGVMTAQITTENQVAKEALESQLQILKDNIEMQGVRVEAIEVTVSSYIFSDSKNAESSEEGQPSNKRGHRSISGVGENEAATEIEAERLQQEVMLQTGSTVNYVA